MAARKRRGDPGGVVTTGADGVPVFGTAIAEFPGLHFAITLGSDGQIDVLTITRQRSVPGSTRITAERLRAIPLGYLRELAATHVVRDASGSSMKAAQAWARDYAEQPRVGARGRDDREYAVIAREYVNLLGTRAPIQRLAERLNLTKAQARNLVFASRERGLLTESGPGRAGGELTDYALELLEED